VKYEVVVENHGVRKVLGNLDMGQEDLLYGVEEVLLLVLVTIRIMVRRSTRR
jgi:hypothetical protein